MIYSVIEMNYCQARKYFIGLIACNWKESLVQSNFDHKDFFLISLSFHSCKENKISELPLKIVCVPEGFIKLACLKSMPLVGC